MESCQVPGLEDRTVTRTVGSLPSRGLRSRGEADNKHEYTCGRANTNGGAERGVLQADPGSPGKPNSDFRRRCPRLTQRTSTDQNDATTGVLPLIARWSALVTPATKQALGTHGHWLSLTFLSPGFPS